MIDDSKTAYIVITHEESMNWITSGRLLFDLSRVTTAEKGIEGSLDWAYFRILLDRAPYMGIEDGAYIITELKSDYVISNAGLHIKHVSSFIPMTDRAYRLTSDNFKSKNYHLQEAKFEDHWKRWAEERIQNSASFRADEFLHLLCLSKVLNPAQGQGDCRHYFIDDPKKRVEIKADLNEMEETHWYGWYFALNLWIKEKDKKRINEEFNLKETKARLINDQNIKKPYLETRMCDSCDRIEKKIEIIDSSLPPIVVIATVIHYWMVFEAQPHNVELDSLKKDLVEIGLRYSPAFSASVAYSIARKMPDEALSSLFYKKNIDLDIFRAIDKLRVSRPQETIVNQQATDPLSEISKPSSEGLGNLEKSEVKSNISEETKVESDTDTTTPLKDASKSTVPNQSATPKKDNKQEQKSKKPTSKRTSTSTTTKPIMKKTTPKDTSKSTVPNQSATPKKDNKQEQKNKKPTSTTTKPTNKKSNSSGNSRNRSKPGKKRQPGVQQAFRYK